jgi:hypothetical protein
LAGAEAGSFQRTLALIDTALDVLEHDDRIVDHQADGEDQRQQRQDVDRVPHGVHEDEAADQRDRDGHRRHQCGAERAQEQQNDQHHQAQSFEQAFQHLVNRGIDEDRIVGADLDPHAIGQHRLQGLDLGAHSLGDRHGVRLRLAQHGEADRLDVVGPDIGAVVLDAARHLCDIAELHRIAGNLRHHQLAKGLGIIDPPGKLDGEFTVERLHLAGGQLDIAAAERLLDICHRDVAGRHGGAVEPDPHGVAPLSVDRDARHAVERRQPVDHEPIDEIGDLGSAHPVAGDGEPHHRIGIGVVLDDLRLLDVVRQLLADPGDGASDIVGRLVDIAADLELDGGRAHSLARLRGDGLDAADAGDTALDDLGDVRVDGGWVGAGIFGGDGDHRGIDIGQLTQWQPQHRGDSEDNDEHAHHARQHRPLDAEVGEGHPRPPDSAVAGGEIWLASTGEPSRTRWMPRVITRSPVFRPWVISTMPGSRNPSLTSRRVALPLAIRKT